MPTDRLASLIASFRGKRLVVFGDLIADEYVYGRVARVSREAPVLILDYDATEIVPGGAGNAANNVASLGASVTLVSLVGRDEAGRRLFQVLPRGVERWGLARPGGYRTPVKTRILAGGIHSAKQQVVRIDRFASEPVADRHRIAAERVARKAVKGADAVLISDYGSGLVTPKFVHELAGLVKKGPPKGGRHIGTPSIPILIDSRYALTKYRGLTACTPNESEVEQVLGVTIDDQPPVLERAGRALLTRTRMAAVLVTRGNRGMTVPDASIFGVKLGSTTDIYYLSAVTFWLVVLVILNVLRSRTGRALSALRDSDVAAESMGINLAQFKTTAFAISATVTGLAGALYAHKLAFISPEQFGIMVSVEFLMTIIIGGLGSLHGAVFGAMFFILLPQLIVAVKAYLPAKIAELPVLESATFGVLVILFVLFEPRGLNGYWVRIKAYVSLFPFYRQGMFRRSKIAASDLIKH